MGRPLFSEAYTAPAPAVRVAEPTDDGAGEDVFPTYPRWSPLGDWDPDADEIFEGGDVVYEAFLTPEQVAAHARATHTEIEGLAAEEDESPSSSEGSEGAMSGRATPMAVGGDDPATLVAAALQPYGNSVRLESAEDFRGSEAQIVTIDFARISPPPLETIPLPHAAERTTLLQSARSFPASVRATATPSNFSVQATPRVLGVNAWTFESLSSTPTARSRTPPPAEPRAVPVTPPAPQTPRTLAAPSPALATPHILSWGRLAPGTVLGSSPPVRDGPLSNAGARRSLAHIAPAQLRV